MDERTPSEGHVASAPPRKRLVWLLAAGLLLGTAVAVVAVLPAEFRIDPTGLGRLTGLDKLAGPKEVAVAVNEASGGSAAFLAETPYRTDAVDIPLKRSGTLFQDELEWKVRMKAGAVVVYSWTVSPITDPEEFYFAFHGQTEPAPGEEKPEIKVITYKEDTALTQSGALVAPFDGLHGWYLQNQSGQPVTVRLNLAGYYAIATQEEIQAAAAALPQGPPPGIE